MYLYSQLDISYIYKPLGVSFRGTGPREAAEGASFLFATRKGTVFSSNTSTGKPLWSLSCCQRECHGGASCPSRLRAPSPLPSGLSAGLSGTYDSHIAAWPAGPQQTDHTIAQELCGKLGVGSANKWKGLGLIGDKTTTPTQQSIAVPEAYSL